VDEREVAGRRYSELLSDRDLLLLSGGRADHAAALRRQPALLPDVLDRPSVADEVLATQHDSREQFRYVSPFLLFAAAVHRASSGLVGATHVPDRTGLRQRVPVFDAPQLAAFATAPPHRLFLAELLTSYSRLASGTTMRRTEQGWRRRRWNELDLPALAGLLHDLPEQQRPAVWRRLGDGALFLAGVFPDHAERSLGLVEVARLQRTTGLRISGADMGAIQLLEELAGRAYERSGLNIPSGVVQAPAFARRVLTLVADRYLFPGASTGLAAPGA